MSVIGFILVSDVKYGDSVLPQDSLETVFQCLGLGLEGWCLVNNTDFGGCRLSVVISCMRS